MRLAIVGSSHVGAIKEAEAAIRAAHLTLQISWFAVPGGAFRRCRMLGQSFVADPQSTAEADRIRALNGDLSIDLGDVDHVWAIGYRFGFGAALGAYLAGENGQVADIVAASVAGIAAQWGDQALTISPAPYPALRARAPGPKQEPRLRDILRSRARDAQFTHFEDTITRALADTPYKFLPQPDQTRAAPFATANQFLQGARDFQTGHPLQGDLRHMNRAYGRALFEEFAAHRL